MKRNVVTKTVASSGSDPGKAIDLAVAQIEKRFGEGSIMRLGSGTSIVPVDVISTGSLSLDVALGVGGVPHGRIVEVYGPEGSGKTTLTSSIIAQAQKKGGQAAFIDAEHAFDVKYAKEIGVDVDNLLISQPDTGEQALEITEVLVRSGALDVVVIDSVAALVPAAELNGDMGDAHVGLQARLMSQALRKLTGVVHKTRTCLIFTNQIRMKIGVMFGSPETTSGGNALKFYASVRMDLRRIGALKEGDVITGNRTKVKVVKNKVAPPFRIAEFDLLYGKGISYEGDLLDLGSDVEIIKKSGTWYSYLDERLGQGKEAARRFLKANVELRDEIDAKVRAHYGIEAREKAAPDETKGAAVSDASDLSVTATSAGAKVVDEKAPVTATSAGAKVVDGKASVTAPSVGARVVDGKAPVTAPSVGAKVVDGKAPVTVTNGGGRTRSARAAKK